MREALRSPAMRKRARVAYRFLKASKYSAYREFHDDHKRFLRKTPNPEDRQRVRWCKFIERPGVECAMWPTLFWDRNMCLTVERHTNPLRKENYGRHSLEDDLAGYVSSTSEEDLDIVDMCRNVGPAPSTAPHSTKRCFIALALSPHTGYVASYEILHFAYDLNLWTSLGAKRNLSLQVPMRVLLKGETFSPMFWRKPHLAMIDLVRQRGYPQLFWTMAPYEWSMPYHVTMLED